MSQAFAQVAQSALIPTDRLARWGGEEFLLLMPETGLPTAQQRLEDLQQRIREHDWSRYADGMTVSFSAGLCEPGGRVPLHRDLERADRAPLQSQSPGPCPHGAGRPHMSASTAILVRPAAGHRAPPARPLAC